MAVFNDAHKRSFQSLAHVIEDKIQEIEDLLREGKQTPGDVLLIVKDDITPEQKEFIRKQIATMRKLLKEFAAEHGLQQQQQSLKQMVSIKAAFLWEELSGATFERLQGYGKVNPSEKARYEEIVEPMVTTAEHIMLYNKLSK